jgi:branched-chain amino acid aminotransferase
VPRYCWLGEKLVTERSAKVSVLDRGLLLGEGVFETMRAYNGKVFALGRHYRRMKEGAKTLGIRVPPLRSIEDAIDVLLQANRLEDARVRLTVTSGPGGPGILPSGPVEPTLIILAHPLDSISERLYRKGARAITLPIRKSAGTTLAGIKTISYAENVIGRRIAKRHGVDEGIFLNTEGDLCEGTASNIFLIKYENLYTPDRDSGCLPGITREVVLELAPKAGLKPLERALSPIDLADADEAFLTSSTREIIPLVEVDGEEIADGRPGPITSELHRLYKETVEKLCPPHM